MAPFGHWQGTLLPYKVPFDSGNRAVGLCHTLRLGEEGAPLPMDVHMHHGQWARHIHKDPPDWRWVAPHDRAAVDGQVVWAPLQVSKDAGEDLVVDEFVTDATGGAAVDEKVAGGELAVAAEGGIGAAVVVVVRMGGEEGVGADAEPVRDGDNPDRDRLLKPSQTGQDRRRRRSRLRRRTGRQNYSPGCLFLEKSRRYK